MLTAKENFIDFDFDDEQEEHIGENKYFQEFSTEEEYQENRDYMKKPHVAFVTNTEQLHYCNPLVVKKEYVEIGGTKWATMNIGAYSVTDAGLYFQWGDTRGYTSDQCGSGEGQKIFRWSTYKYTGDYGGTFTKYNTIDGLTTLQSSDDAATVIWGGNWRMPTTEEFQALHSATNSEWIVDYQGSGVNGLLLTDKTDNSKTLFFPAVGDCIEDEFVGEGEYGIYWSSSLKVYSNLKEAYALILSDDSVDWDFTNSRYLGFSVRGVYDNVVAAGGDKEGWAD